MSIVLSILQIIGWIFLAVLLLLVSALLIVLFCPVHYLIEGEFLEEKWARFKVHWLLHLIRAKVSYGDDLIYGEVHAFWKKMTFSFDLTKKEDEAEDEMDELGEEVEEAVADEVVSDEANGDSLGDVQKVVSDERDEDSLENLKDVVLGETDEDTSGEEKEIISDEMNEDSLGEKKKVTSKDEKENTAQASECKEKVIGTETATELRGEASDTTEAENEDRSDTESKEDLENGESRATTDHSDRQKDTDEKEVFTEEQKESIVSKIKGIIERIKEVYPKIKMILSDEKNHAAVKHLKDEVIYLIKILLPRESSIDVVFSTGSPDTTGQFFGVLACFPAMYKQDWKLLPDFEADEPYMKGSFWGRGRLSGYQLVGIVLRILFDKNCRRLYTMINKFLKWLKKDDKSQEEK